MSNVIVIMFFTGIILIYIDMKLDSPKIEKDKKNEKELHKRITERYSGSADIFTPMFNTQIDELWLASK